MVVTPQALLDIDTENHVLAEIVMDSTEVKLT